MAKQPRKQAQTKPITQHQLFPAVIALWFGALFGLGSLAVRPSLLESLVIKSRIDLVIPAAAPPLGITSRILVALILAAIGSAIGIAIARRLARPKIEVRERKRSKLAADEAPVRRPYGPAAASESAGPVLAPRRRALAIEHEEEQFVPHDMAPLPGGAPQILDISSVGLRAEPVEAPLDLGGYPAPSPAEHTDLAGFVPQPVVAPAEPRQMFQPLDHAVQPAVEAHPNHPAAEAAAAAADGRQVFGLPPVTEATEAPKQIFGQQVAGEHVSQDFVKAAGYQTTVFETPEPQQLFPPREQAATPASFASEASFAMPQAFEVPPAPVVQPFAVPNAEVPPSSLDAVQQPAVPQAFAPTTSQPGPAPVVAAQLEPVAAEPLPSPAGLAMDDLSARLAASMARRRAALGGPPADTAPPVQQVPTFAMPQAEPAVAAEAPAAPFNVPDTAEAAPVPQAYDPAPQSVPGIESVLQPAAFAAPFAAPFAEQVPQPAAQMPSPSIPDAMRPLELGGFEDEAEPIDHLLPPRHIAMPQPVAAAAPAMPAAFAPPAEPAEEAEMAQAEVAEENYASLLGIAPAPARSGFVRIEEPEAEATAIEPVVVFPGQMAQPASQTSFRPFDAPASAGQGQQVSAGEVAPSVDREEADRALRMALANLQRMSGAA